MPVRCKKPIALFIEATAATTMTLSYTNSLEWLSNMNSMYTKFVYLAVLASQRWQPFRLWQSNFTETIFNIPTTTTTIQR